jgi:hypothetical protein
MHDEDWEAMLSRKAFLKGIRRLPFPCFSMPCLIQAVRHRLLEEFRRNDPVSEPVGTRRHGWGASGDPENQILRKLNYPNSTSQ